MGLLVFHVTISCHLIKVQQLPTLRTCICIRENDETNVSIPYPVFRVCIDFLHGFRYSYPVIIIALSLNAANEARYYTGVEAQLPWDQLKAGF